MRTLIAIAALALSMGQASAQVLTVEHVSAAPGRAVQVEVAFETALEITALEVELALPWVLGPTAEGIADCSIAPGVDREAGGFSFLPRDCVRLGGCEVLRSIVLSFERARITVPLRDGPVFTCTLRVASWAKPGRYPIGCPRALGSAWRDKPEEIQAFPVKCRAGALTVTEPEECPGDTDADGEVVVGELVGAVRNLMDGCP